MPAEPNLALKNELLFPILPSCLDKSHGNKRHALEMRSLRAFQASRPLPLFQVDRMRLENFLQCTQSFDGFFKHISLILSHHRQNDNTFIKVIYVILEVFASECIHSLFMVIFFAKPFSSQRRMRALSLSLYINLYQDVQN